MLEILCVPKNRSYLTRSKLTNAIHCSLNLGVETGASADDIHYRNRYLKERTDSQLKSFIWKGACLLKVKRTRVLLGRSCKER